MSKSENTDSSNRNYSPESLNKSLNESLNIPSPLAGVSSNKPVNMKPAALPPSPPKRPKND